MKATTYSILFLPQPKKLDSPLNSWNLLAVEIPLQYGIIRHDLQELVIYTEAKSEDISEVIDFATNLGFEKVHVISGIGDKVINSAEEYSETFKDFFTKPFQNKKVQINKIFWTMGTIFPGVQTYSENTEKINIELQHLAGQKCNVTDRYSNRHAIYCGILNYLNQFHMPMVHQLIIDPVEADVSVYIMDDFHYNIRRHFVHPLQNRASVYVNRFMIEPFFNEASDFYHGDVIVSSEKELKFTFGLTGYDDIRKMFIKDLKEILNPEYNFYYCYTETDENDESKTIDTRIKYEDYLKELHNCRTTLLIPAYDTETFSMHRFVEAISVGCLPIIFEAVYEYGFASFTDTLKVVEQFLVIDDLSELNDKIEYLSTNHKSILAEILSTSYFVLLKSESQRKANYRLFN